MLKRDYSREKQYGGLTDKDKDDIIKKEIRELGFRGKITLRPQSIDLTDFFFDKQHINDRSHGISLDKATEYVENAKVMFSKWDGQAKNYFSENGATYIFPDEKKIRTSFSSDEYDDKTKMLMEVLKKYGI